MINADKFKREFGLYATELWAMTEAEFLTWLNAEAQPERKTGEWIRGDAEKLTGKWRCSICGNTIYSETKRDREKFHAFCGHCGADMRGEADDN